MGKKSDFCFEKKKKTKKVHGKFIQTFDRKKEIILSAIIKKCVFKTEFLKKEKKKFEPPSRASYEEVKLTKTNSEGEDSSIKKIFATRKTTKKSQVIQENLLE